jgi:hypothetical protein
VNATFLSSVNKSETGLLAQGLVWNSTQVGYSSGDHLLVSLNLYNLNQSSSIRIDSITAPGGFEILSTSPPLPSSLGASPLQLTVWLAAPSSSGYYGQLVFTVVTG